ncbi:unnamed protein product [Withania somnifera]
MGEGGGTAHFRVQSIVRESLGLLPAPSRPASCSRGGGVLERTTHCCVAPTQGRAFGEEHCFEGEKAWLTNQSSEATGVLSSNDACGLSHSHPKWCPDSAWPVGKRFT